MKKKGEDSDEKEGRNVIKTNSEEQDNEFEENRIFKHRLDLRNRMCLSWSRSENVSPHQHHCFRRTDRPMRKTTRKER